MIDYSEKAMEDLDGIYDYTKSNWSISQADKYIMGITSEVDKILQDNIYGRRLNLVDKRNMYIRYKSHIIVYRNLSESIFVIRILHKNMNIIRHLK
jgi:toxin ParE1/3/4